MQASLNNCGLDGTSGDHTIFHEASTALLQVASSIPRRIYLILISSYYLLGVQAFYVACLDRHSINSSYRLSFLLSM